MTMKNYLQKKIGIEIRSSFINNQFLLEILFHLTVQFARSANCLRKEFTFVKIVIEFNARIPNGKPLGRSR